MGQQMRVRFWGVRGSTPTPQAENLKFGGNTSCVEITTPTGESLIFDAGSGIRALGQKLVHEANGEPIGANIFLTHFHWDHIRDFPSSHLFMARRTRSHSTPGARAAISRKRSKARWRSLIIRSISPR